jgi:hypothetical protein
LVISVYSILLYDLLGLVWFGLDVCLFVC